MMVLVSYDVSSQDKAGARRLRHIAKTCLDFGQRVQFSVFEIEVDAAQWVALKARLTQIIDPTQDSLRFYYLGDKYHTRIEHFGAKAGYDAEGALII